MTAYQNLLELQAQAIRGDLEWDIEIDEHDLDDILGIIHEARKHVTMQGCPDTCTLRRALTSAGVPKQ